MFWTRFLLLMQGMVVRMCIGIFLNLTLVEFDSFISSISVIVAVVYLMAFTYITTILW
jgi:hypothetical protein